MLEEVSIVTVDSGRNPAWLEEGKQSIRDQKTEVKIDHIIIPNHHNELTLGAAYNLGFEKAKTAFVIVLDDDDVYHPKAVAMFADAVRELEEAGKLEAVFQVCTHQLLLDSNGEAIGTTDAPCQGMLRKDVVQKVGGYPEIPWVVYGRPNLIHSDMRMIMTAVSQGWRQVVLPATLYGWRIHRQPRASAQGTKAAFYNRVLDNAEQGLFKAYNIGEDPDAGARYEGKMLRAMARNIQFQNGLKYDAEGNVVFQPTLPPEEDES